jgi:hypothetical protein
LKKPSTSVFETVFPEYDVEGFAGINPIPEIRELDLEIDLGFYERERIPRDAINPVYTPKFRRKKPLYGPTRSSWGWR